MSSSWIQRRTVYGRLLYEANGFIYVKENVNRPQTDPPDENWKEIDEKVGAFTFLLMWRPVGGKFDQGKTIKPWEKEWFSLQNSLSLGSRADMKFLFYSMGLHRL